MKKVLIITYYWPPAGGVAVQRWLKFTKYLPEYGWQPIVITVKNGSYPYTDESLQKDISAGMEVYATDTFEPFELYNLLRGKKGKSVPMVAVGARGNKSFFEKATEYIRANFFIPDARKGWLPYAVRQAKTLIEKHKIDAIITTGPPHSTHLIGLELQRRYGLKWIADFRDPWTKSLVNENLPQTRSTKIKDKKIEDSVIKNADVVVVISEGMKTEFGDRAKKIEVIYNGYDEDDMDISPIITPNIFTLRHIGSLIITMNVPELWQAISELRSENDHFKKHFLLEIVGSAHHYVWSEFKKYGIEDAVKDIGFVSHDKAVAYMKGAGSLLFLVSNVVHSEVLMSGKIFEYLAADAPVLAIGPVDGNAAALLRECERKGIIAFHDKDGMKKNLLEYYNDWVRNKGNVSIEGNKHEFYTRRLQCRKLAEILNKL